MRPAPLVRLALAGTRSDTARVVLTGLSATLATLAFLAALTVHAIPTPPPSSPDEDPAHVVSPQYVNHLLAEPGLRPGVAITLLLLTIPVLALAGQCARLGAPARDRRLAAIRLAGATPRQTVAIAATETGVASLFGTVAGLVIYLVGRVLLNNPDENGQLALPTDVLPSAGAIAAVVLALPVLAALAAALLLRRVVVTPFGVIRTVRRRRAPRPWPGLLIVLGLAVPMVEVWLVHTGRVGPTAEGQVVLVFFVSVLAAVLGVVLGAGWISYAAGRLLHRFARRPATLLAARRLIADPFANSRTFGALLTSLVFAGGAAAVRMYFSLSRQVEVEQAARQGYSVSPDDFYLRTMDLINLAIAMALVIAAGGLLVAIVDSVVARRRTYAALVAAGVPRAVLGRSIAWHALLPVVPAIAIALAVGVQFGRSMYSDPTASHDVSAWAPFDNAVPVPFADLAYFGAGALVVALVIVGVGLIFLRRSTALEELRA